MEENISKFAGATGGEFLPKEEMVKIIKAVGRIPKQRSTLYEILD